MPILASDLSQIRDKKLCWGFPRACYDSTLYILVIRYFPGASGTKPAVNLTKKAGKKEIDK